MGDSVNQRLRENSGRNKNQRFCFLLRIGFAFEEVAQIGDITEERYFLNLDQLLSFLCVCRRPKRGLRMSRATILRRRLNLMAAQSR